MQVPNLCAVPILATSFCPNITFPFHSSCPSVSQTNGRTFSSKINVWAVTFWRSSNHPPYFISLSFQPVLQSHLPFQCTLPHPPAPKSVFSHISWFHLCYRVCPVTSSLHLHSTSLAERFAQMSPTSQKFSGTLIWARFSFQNNVTHGDIKLTSLISNVPISLQ